MKDHDDDVGATATECTVKESTEAVDGIPTEKLGGGERKIEAFSSERDEEDEVMVDVVGTDDGNGDKGGNLGSERGSDEKIKEDLEKETQTGDIKMEDVGNLGGEVCDVSAETTVLTYEKVEVVVTEEVVERSEESSKEVVGNDVVSTAMDGLNDEVPKSEYETLHGDSKMVLESSCGAPQVGGGEIGERGLTEENMEQATESVQEMADGDHVLDGGAGKEAEVLDSSKMPESPTNLDSEEVDVGVREEGLTRKDEAPDSGSKEVDAGVREECLTSKDEAPDGDYVDPSSASAVNESSMIEVVKSGGGVGDACVVAEDLDQQAEVDLMRKEENLPTMEVTETDVSHGNMHCTVEQQLVDVKPAGECSESHDAPGGDLISFPDTSKAFAGGGVERIGENVPSHFTVEVSTEHHPSVIGGDDGAIIASADSVSCVAHSEAAAPSDTKASVVDSAEVIETAIPDSEVPDSKVQDLSTGRMEGVIENQGLKGNAVIGSYEAGVAACSEPELSNDHTVPATANKVTETDSGDQKCGEEIPKTGDMSSFVEDHGMQVEAVSKSSQIDEAVCGVQEHSNDKILLGDDNEVTMVHTEFQNSKVEVPIAGEMGGLQVSSEDFEHAKHETTDADDAQRVVPPADPAFSFEEANIEGEEDPGMDIDEVLSWKGEIPGIDALNGNVSCPEKDHHYKIDGNSETDVEQGCEPVLIGQQEEDPKFRQPIVYERRAHVEVLFPDFDGSSSCQMKDENLKVEILARNSDGDNRSVQEEEQKLVGPSTNLPSSDKMVDEQPSSLAPLNTLDGGNHHPEGHVIYTEDSGMADKEHHSLPVVQDGDKQVVDSAPLHVPVCFDERGSNDSTRLGSSMGKEVDVEHIGNRMQTNICKEQDTETLESSEAEPSTGIDDEITESLKNETFLSLQQSCYFQPQENEGEFSVSDLVWGKVRSHPWWPGQIFDSSDASEKAMKYHKKDCFLVAYFGDGTFAWNDSTVLKPFRTNFSQIVKKHNSSEAFRNAVSCALEEVCRRVELGLACSCISQDVHEKIEYQVVENGGIRQESSRRHGIDKSAGVGSFEPDKLVDYVRLLAQSPYGDGDKLELAIAKAQLSSYGRYRGYRQLPEFQSSEDLLEVTDDAPILGQIVVHVNEDGEQISDMGYFGGDYKSSHKLEDNLMDRAYPNKKERSLSELMDDAPYSAHGEDGAGVDGTISYNLVSPSGAKKRKALDSISEGSEKKLSLHPEKVPPAPAPAPAPAPVLAPAQKPSFKVGASILRVASQLTGSPSILKFSSDKKVEHGDQPGAFAVSMQSPDNSQRGRIVVPGDQASLDEMLSQLHLAAQDPMKGYSFLSTIIPFFSSYRSVVVSKSRRQNSSTGRPGGARKRKTANENDPEEFEFDDVNDSYWTDRIIQNYSEEQLLQDNQNGGGEHQIVAYEQDKPAKPGRRSNKKRFFNSNHEIEADEQSELVERRRQNLATEVVLKFAEGIYFTSEMNLNKMFRRFGPLMESETEVDRQSGRARVVFKKCSDAEVAHSSAGKFNIFGSINVNYELNYTPLVSYKPLPLPTLQDPEDAI